MRVATSLLGGVGVGSLFLLLKDGATSEVQVVVLIGLIVGLTASALWMVMADD